MLGRLDRAAEAAKEWTRAADLARTAAERLYFQARAQASIQPQY